MSKQPPRPQPQRPPKKSVTIIMISVGKFHVVGKDGKSHFTGSYGDCEQYVNNSPHLTFEQS